MSYTTVLALRGRLCKGSLVRGWGWVHHTLTPFPTSDADPGAQGQARKIKDCNLFFVL